MRATRSPLRFPSRSAVGLGVVLALAACAGGTRAPVSQPEREAERERKQEATPEGDRAAEAAFHASLERMVGQDPNLDFWQLRREFAATANYSPYSDDAVDTPIDLAFTAIHEDRYEDALASARQALERNPIHPKANFAARIAAERLGKSDLAQFYAWVLDRLAASICGERSGLDVADPCPVIAVDEEYYFLHTRGLKDRGQSLIACGETKCDAMDVVDPRTNEEATYYFDVTLPMWFLDKRFE